MSRTSLYGCLIAFLFLCPALCRAEKPDVTHNFHNDAPYAAKLKFYDDNHVGVTPLLTYTCSGGAEFWKDLFNKKDSEKKISINFSGINQFVTTSAVEDLSELEIKFYPASEYRPNLELRLSYDSIHWSNPIDADYSLKGFVKASFLPGKYYVRLKNTSASADRHASVFEIKYSFSDGCNCFMYIP